MGVADGLADWNLGTRSRSLSGWGRGRIRGILSPSFMEGLSRLRFGISVDEGFQAYSCWERHLYDILADCVSHFPFFQFWHTFHSIFHERSVNVSFSPSTLVRDLWLALCHCKGVRRMDISFDNLLQFSTWSGFVWEQCILSSLSICWNIFSTRRVHGSTISGASFVIISLHYLPVEHASSFGTQTRDFRIA